MTVAILHDQFTTRGGAERVAFAAARGLDADLFAMRVDDDVVPDDLDVTCLCDSRLGHRAMRSHHLATDAYQMIAWQQQPDLAEYDVVFQNKTNPYWYVPREHQTVVRYCHSPPRGLYDQFARAESTIPSIGLKTAMRALYRQTVPYADLWLHNSELVERRSRQYFGLDSDETAVVHPPVAVNDFDPDAAPTGDHLFTVGRLRDHKRVDRLVAVAEYLDRPVRIAGEGPARDRLERAAPDNVQFLGYVDEREKRRQLAAARAFVFLGENEDFGMTPIEALASGTSVIGVDEGFTQYQIGRDQQRGVLCEPTVSALHDAIRTVVREGVAWGPDRLAAWARANFGVEQFQREVRAAVDRAREQARISVDWQEPPAEPERPAEITARADGGER